eukprot:CAMPEP_0182426644 /NCGR_PEP_ID=MMETSP1167-20130531/13163_1 /TAXON_ID=2988 /ORGANISM="Mallomonas Sp, Strain CCMP3275" /LENGTH=230 /DNA_ID=CAMNT_0024608245 /DNA_START=128 /DNA_END=820 /DNA_ORIENTATION=+
MAKDAVGDGKQGAVAACDVEVSRVKEIKKSFGLELRMIKDKSLKVQYDGKIKENEIRFSDLNKELAHIKESLDKQELTQGSHRKVLDTEGKTNEELLMGAVKVQEGTMASLDRTKALIEQSKEVGAATVDVLRQQRDQIKDIDQEVTNIDNNLVKAEKLIVNFGKRMATDRVIQALTTCNIMILIAIIVYVIYTKQGLNSDSDQDIGLNTDQTFVPTMQPTAAGMKRFLR